MLEQNVGTLDRYIRITLGGMLIAASASRMATRSGGTAVGLGLLGGMMLAEGILGTCPLYSAVGINTQTDHGWRREDANDWIQPYEGI